MIRNVTHYWKFSLSYDKKWNILQKELKPYLIPNRQCPLERRNSWERERVREARGRSKVSEDWRTPTSRELSFFRIEIFLFNQTLSYILRNFFQIFGFVVVLWISMELMSQRALNSKCWAKFTKYGKDWCFIKYFR